MRRSGRGSVEAEINRLVGLFSILHSEKVFSEIVTTNLYFRSCTTVIFSNIDFTHCYWLHLEYITVGFFVILGIHGPFVITFHLKVKHAIYKVNVI